MKIVLTSVLVDDQEKALCFYRDILGFQLKHDIPLGAHRWLTVVSPEQPDGVEPCDKRRGVVPGPKNRHRIPAHSTLRSNGHAPKSRAAQGS